MLTRKGADASSRGAQRRVFILQEQPNCNAETESLPFIFALLIEWR
jgi:hypothetical protein